MDETVKAMMDAMQQQQILFQKQMLELIAKSDERSVQQVVGNTPAIPKFDSFDKETEKWHIYLERFNQHFAVYSVTNANQKRACLLSWVGAPTYDLLMNLCGSEDITTKSFTELTDKLSEHYKDSVHIQAARYEFYQCKMKQNQTYADWAAELRGLARHCNFTCKNEECKQSYVDDQIRDVIIKETPHADVRRQCLLDSNPSLECVLTKATTYLKTTETDRVLKGEPKELQSEPDAVNKMSDTYQHKTKRTAHNSSNSKTNTSLKSCPNCFIKHERKDCPCRELVCRICNKKGHISPVCKSRNAQSPGTEQQNSNLAEESVCTVSHNSKQAKVTESTTKVSVTERIGKQIWVNCKVNGISSRFQWDTGATCSMIGLQGFKQLGSPKLTETKTCISGYGDRKLQVKGECYVDVAVGDMLRHNLRLLVVDTPVGSNLFGLDWSDQFRLSQLGLSAVQEIVNTVHSEPVKDLQNKISSLAAKYPEVFKEGLGCCTKLKAPIHLKEGARPVFFKPREVPFSRRDAVKAEIERLVEAGVLQHIDFSEYAAPIVAVSKPNGKVRICGDFKLLNKQISVDQHPLPKLDELMEKLQGGQHFTKIDLADAYLQIELDEQAKKLCVINTPLGLFRYSRMCFGVASSPAQFQRCMDTMTSDLPGVAAYLDDLIVTGKTNEEHWNNLNKLFARLQEYGFRIQQAKCQFFKTSVDYLGHHINKDGKQPSNDAITALERLPQPQNIQETKAFLGKINYYGRFIHNLADKAAPLNRLLCKNAVFQWTPQCSESFEQLKRDVIRATTLTHFDASKPLILATDASQYGIGAVLLQREDGIERPIAHASKTLNAQQRNYSQIEKEGLSIIYGVSKFRQYLFGRRFTLITDHEPLVAIFSPDKNIPILTAQRLQRWALTLMAYQYDIQYKPTQQHGNADGLSRLPHGPDQAFDIKEAYESEEISHTIQEDLSVSPLDAHLIQHETARDTDLLLVTEWVTQGNWPRRLPENLTHLLPYQRMKDSLFIHKGILMLQRDAHARVVVPSSVTSQTLDTLHTSHWGIVRMKQLARRYVWWPSIGEDIEKMVKICEPCCLSANEPKPIYSAWPTTQKPWERIHLDFAGPFKDKMWLLCVDAYSKYPYVAMLEIGSTTSAHTIAALRHIFITEGLPETIVTDNGRQFVSGEFEEFCRLNGICHLTSAPFHPASNGEAERFVQSLKRSVEKTCVGGDTPKLALQKFLSTYRCMPHPALDWKSPAEVLHGRQPRNLLSLLGPSQLASTAKSKVQSTNKYDVDSLVYARNYRSGPKWLEGKVTAKVGDVMYNIHTDRGIWKRHANQLQPRVYVSDSTTTSNLPSITTVSPQPASASTLAPDQITQPPSSPRYPRRDHRRPDFYQGSK